MLLASIPFSEIIFLAAGPEFLVLSLTISSFLFFVFFVAGLSITFSLTGSAAPSDSLNSPITSELDTVSPSDFIIFVITPSDCAKTSSTTLSVSISTITSS